MHPWIVSEDAGSITGYAYAGRFASRPAYGWLVETSVYVAESARGSGISKCLWGRFDDWCVDRPHSGRICRCRNPDAH